ncbi:hypothetical protein [Palleronia caenipelagi]|uniref:Uncharacterized protein n=1 Tax=Palleronia caenipelagi TaxID=2489174 RepID=A0A547PY00_9RHOB|nr:hypothetical protein [Palleronia caenipelagi]TRD19041.1 hypothetical protein FEV53_11155 [Palleronia caenipelagi]
MTEHLKPLQDLSNIISHVEKSETDFGECAGLFAAAEALCAKLEKVILESHNDDPYAGGKLLGVRLYLGAALGFGTDTGHDSTRNLEIARQDLRVLCNVLNRSRESC